jgi:hypothetical protein
LKIAAALGLLAALYWHCDWRLVARALSDLDAGYLALAFALFLPQTAVSAWRWQLLAAAISPISLLESIRQTLVASAWNLAAPSKLGDFSKVAMQPREAVSNRRKAWLLVVMEKLGDIAALALLWLAGAVWRWHGGGMIALALIAILGGLALSAAYCILRTPCSAVIRTSHSAFRIAAASLLLWLLHLGQLHLMLLAAGVNVGFEVSLSRVPAAIFAGLAPVSLWGIGTRDGVLIWLFSDVAPAGTMAAVGLLTATRYLVPGAAGIACLSFVPHSGDGTSHPPLTRSARPAALPQQAGG